jgi:hypothetical protein
VLQQDATGVIDEDGTVEDAARRAFFQSEDDGHAVLACAGAERACESTGDRL